MYFSDDVSKNLIKTLYYYIRSKSLITPHSTQQTPPQWFLRGGGLPSTIQVIKGGNVK